MKISLPSVVLWEFFAYNEKQNGTVMQKEFLIRSYQPSDRQRLRKISYETAFFDQPQKFSDDEEIISDALTIYFTDFTPESCWVVCLGQEVIGYLIGTRDVIRMKSVFIQKIGPCLFLKALRKGYFLKGKSFHFCFRAFKSLIKGEFRVPNFSNEYPAAFHVNITGPFRGSHLGTELVEHFCDYLKKNRIHGVQISTMSDKAKSFYEKLGFGTLYAGRRSFLHYQMGFDVPIYILGKKF